MIPKMGKDGLLPQLVARAPGFGGDAVGHVLGPRRLGGRCGGVGFLFQIPHPPSVPLAPHGGQHAHATGGALGARLHRPHGRFAQEATAR